MFDILPTDKVFANSPFAGHPDCICSRCGNHIDDGSHEIRCWTTDKITDITIEWRYCDDCVKAAGIT